MGIEGVLFLTAGFGTRDEPLSLIRPKCLLPWGDLTVLGRLARQVEAADPRTVTVNASRCPDEILAELEEVWSGGRCRLYFEERPLGSTSTLSRLSATMAEDSWMLVNTDMVISGLDTGALVRYHRKTGAHWTALTGSFPQRGEYSPLLLDEEMCFGGGGSLKAHYWGISIMEPRVIELAAERQLSGGLFSRLAPLAREMGMKTVACRSEGEWFDLGRIGSLRENILRGGRFIHPSACVSSDVRLEGVWNIGRGCILGSGTEVSNSVMLEGSTLESGRLEDAILPWFCSSMDGVNQ